MLLKRSTLLGGSSEPRVKLSSRFTAGDANKNHLQSPVTATSHPHTHTQVLLCCTRWGRMGSAALDPRALGGPRDPWAGLEQSPGSPTPPPSTKEPTLKGHSCPSPQKGALKGASPQTLNTPFTTLSSTKDGRYQRGSGQPGCFPGSKPVCGHCNIVHLMAGGQAEQGKYQFLL